MRLKNGARVAVIGAGPGGLTAAKHALEAGFEVSVYEGSDDLGGQWYTAAPHSGAWPGMRTNTSRAMTAFSDFPYPADHDLHPLAEQVHGYLRAYAAAFGVHSRIRFDTPVLRVERGWRVDGELFDGVIVASGRFRNPVLPPRVEQFEGELLHAYDYPGAAHFRDRRTLVYGNGVSGHEIASDIATVAPTVSAYRKPRYVIQKVVDGVSSDWRWYTHLSAVRKRVMGKEEFGRLLRDRVLRQAGNPADFGAPVPDDDILVAGHSLCQDYLAQVREGSIVCRPAISAIDGRTVTFADGSVERVDAMVCATGYGLDIPYLPDDVWSVLGPGLALHHRTLHPDLPGLAFVGQFATQGPFLPLLELQGRWIAGVWSGVIPPPDAATMRANLSQPAPAVDAHDSLALLLSESAGVAPDLRSRPELAESLLFGPMLPARYRLDGFGAMPWAAERFSEQLASSPRPGVDPEDLAALTTLGLGDLVPLLVP